MRTNLAFGTVGAAVAAFAFAAVCMTGAKDSAASDARAASPVLAAGSHVDGNHFKLDGTPSGDCKAGADCSVTIRLEAQGEYHINQQYPYKFKAADSPGVEYLGTDASGKNIFSKTAGDFKIDGEKNATMNVRFKAAKGTANISGTYKMSVCSAQNCQLEQQELSIAVAVK